MSEVQFDLTGLVNAVIGAFTSLVSGFASAIQSNAEVLGYVAVAMSILGAVTYMLRNTGIGRWFRRVIPFF